MYSSLNVHNRLQELDIPHELFKLSGRAGNLMRAAAALGLESSQVAKVELYRADGMPVMAIIPGDREVDQEKLKAVSGAADVSKVSDEEVTSLTGYQAVTLPPVGHRQEMQCYIDYYTLKEDVVYTGSGEPTAILKIRSYDLVRATGGETVDLVLSAEGSNEPGD
jgi:prolyl-tRNA editing enzyme YbaK/EbsC (Cys-tRNA(Pro) deacylase)